MTTAHNRTRRMVVDWAIAAVVCLVLVTQATVASEPGARPTDPLAYGLVVAIAAATLFRRSRPVWVLVFSVIAILAYHALAYPSIGMSIALAVPLFTVALKGNTMAIVAVVASLAWVFGWLVVGENRSILSSVNTIVREGAIMVAVVLAGAAYRGRRLLAEETTERIRLARIENQTKAVEERLRIARELHDVLAHTVAVIGVQAGVAIDSLDRDLDETRSALQVIKRSTREATTELRTTIGLLRGGDPSPLSPVSSLADLDHLVESIRAGGLPVELTTQGELAEVPRSVQLTAFRVVQEALTNVVKHAGASQAEVAVESTGRRLTVTVRDDGCGGGSEEGHGVRGMKERVSAHGGSLAAGPLDDSGFQVEAVIPW